MRPPNVTIPKTEAALPSNQYATDFELASGKNFLLAGAFAVAVMVSLRDPNGDFDPFSGETTLEKNRGFFNGDFLSNWRGVEVDCFMH